MVSYIGGPLVKRMNQEGKKIHLNESQFLVWKNLHNAFRNVIQKVSRC